MLPESEVKCLTLLAEQLHACSAGRLYAIENYCWLPRPLSHWKRHQWEKIDLRDSLFIEVNPENGVIRNLSFQEQKARGEFADTAKGLALRTLSASKRQVEVKLTSLSNVRGSGWHEPFLQVSAEPGEIEARIDIGEYGGDDMPIMLYPGGKGRKIVLNTVRGRESDKEKWERNRIEIELEPGTGDITKVSFR